MTSEMPNGNAIPHRGMTYQPNPGTPKKPMLAVGILELISATLVQLTPTRNSRQQETKQEKWGEVEGSGGKGRWKGGGREVWKTQIV